jgi:hypothetical protein
MKTPRLLPFAFLLVVSATLLRALPVQDVVASKAPPVLSPLLPSDVRIGGWLGARIDANVSHRLLVVDTDALLEGYRHRPGSQPWIGEHVGKWIHAATLAWLYSGDPALRRKLDSVVASLISTQEPDGYLGTYAPGKRFGLYEDADWDVWCHKYNLIGLLTYYRYTGEPSALAAARRMGDLLCATFPAKRSILDAGTHMGMAATSVLSPMVDLYRLTGEPRYLDFTRYILSAYEEKGGPDIVRALLAGRSVDRVANGKAYEMLSNLVGLAELYQVTGDPRLLKADQNAWNDIVQNRLYVTGTASVRERFSNDHELPNGEAAHLGETCVTTTWIQLNGALLAATGESKYADQIERSLYNHIAAAQQPGDGDWCYYTPLEGVRHYDKEITCCHSSGPRALALAPTFAYLQSGDVLCVNTLETSSGRFRVGGEAVEISEQSGFPYEGRTTLTVRAPGGASFGLRVRAPAWAEPIRAEGAESQGGWISFPRRAWRDGEEVHVTFNLGSRMLRGDYTNYSRVAYTWGPFVLALDMANVHDSGLIEAPQFMRVIDDRLPSLVSDPGRLQLTLPVRGEWGMEPHAVTLVPFADAGEQGKPYAVWLRAP